MRPLRLIGAAVVLLSVVGCNSKNVGQDRAPIDPKCATPEAAVRTFLTGVKNGDDKTVESMLTPLALSETQRCELVVAPPGSETATFEVGDVEMIAEDGAHVASKWSDIDDNGQQQSDTIIWMVRKEENGWRIAGMGAVLFAGEPPIFLNFEDGDDVIRKEEMAAQEIARREEAAALEANGAVPATANSAPAGTPQQLPTQQLPPQQVQSPVQQQPPASTANRPTQQPPTGPSRRQ